MSRPGSQLIVEDSLITNCTAEDGCGVLQGRSRKCSPTQPLCSTRPAEVIFRNSTMLGCTAPFAGAMFLEKGIVVRLQGSSIHGCNAASTGAVYLHGEDAWPPPVLEVTDSIVDDCHSSGGSGGAITAAERSVAIVQRSVFRGCSAATGGGTIYAFNHAELQLQNSSIVDSSARYGGALQLESASTAWLEGLEIADCSATEDGGGLIVSGQSTVSIIGTTIVRCSAKNGGALAVSASTAMLRLTLLANNVAERAGGGVFSEGSRILLAEQTAVVGNLASRPGHALALMIGSTTTYQLPAPPGRWIAGSKCAVYREDCPWLGVAPGRYQEESCLQTVAQCQLEANETAVVGGVACQPVSSSQPCDWRKSPELLGSSVQVLPQEPQDDDYPFDCAAGMVGSADAALQMSALCAGACPAGALPTAALPHHTLRQLGLCDLRGSSPVLAQASTAPPRAPWSPSCAPRVRSAPRARRRQPRAAPAPSAARRASRRPRSARRAPKARGAPPGSRSRVSGATTPPPCRPSSAPRRPLVCSAPPTPRRRTRARPPLRSASAARASSRARPTGWCTARATASSALLARRATRSA